MPAQPGGIFMKKTGNTCPEGRRGGFRTKITAGVILPALIIAMLTSACGTSGGTGASAQVSSETASGASEEAASETQEETVYEELTVVWLENEKEISLYRHSSSEKVCTKVTEVTDEWTDTADLATFTAFVSDEDEISYSTWVTAVKESWNSVTTQEDYKVGYELSFDLDGETIIITILEPEDVENSEYLYNGDYPSSGDYSAITGYMGVWLYDDMAHEPGEWYSHVTSSTKTDSTVLTSIKLRPTPQSDQISNLTLRGFSYYSDAEFDEDGNYIGTHAYTVTITNGE